MLHVTLGFMNRLIKNETAYFTFKLVTACCRGIEPLSEFFKISLSISINISRLLCILYTFDIKIVFYRTKCLKVYKAMSDSLENHKIMNYTVLSNIPNNLLFIIRLWMGSVYAQHINKSVKCLPINTFYSDSVLQSCKIISICDT